MLIGEKPPPWAPCTTIAPISSGLIPYRAAKLSAIGATIATAAGLTAPIAVSAPVSANITHGISATRPRTSRIDAWTSQSVVPLARAIANRYVTPTRTTNRSPGKPAKMPSASRSATSSPTAKAAAKARAPMLTERVVAMTNTTTRTRIEMSWGDIRAPVVGPRSGGRDERLTGSLADWLIG
ncbi:hypothetical protein RKD19_005643 [Streptomyces canus]